MRRFLKRLVNYFSRNVFRTGQGLRHDVDGLYRLLYHLVHDLNRSPDITTLQTQTAFARQWEQLKSGKYLLSDPWFKNNVAQILCEQELLVRPEWFPGKQVLDAGCGNGRWSFGLAKLGAHVTAVDVNPIAIQETQEALAEFTTPQTFVVTPLEHLTRALPPGKTFDLVFSWGVAHHCQSFKRVLDELIQVVKEGGLLYLYLYGRESLPFERDLALFKERVYYNSLPTDQDKYQYLLAKARGNEELVHNMHDLYAPLINRRLTFDQVKVLLDQKGMFRVERTIDHTELFIRAVKGGSGAMEGWFLERAKAPYWFQHHDAA